MRPMHLAPFLSRTALALLVAGLAVSCDDRERIANAETVSREPAPAPPAVELPLEPSPAPSVDLDTDAEVVSEPPAPVASVPLPPPSPAGMRINVLSTRSATVEWTTDHHADSELRWGRSAQLEETPILDPLPTLHHCVLLSGLEAGGVYFVQAASRGAAGEPMETEIVSFQTFTLEMPEVRRTHPRLFITGDDLPALRARLTTSAAGAWRSVRSACEGLLTRPVSEIAQGSSYVSIGRAFAFAGLVGDDARFRQKAEDIAMECVALGTSGEKMDTRERMQVIACVYDWLHPYLSSDTRSRMRTALWNMFGRLDADSNDYEYVWGHSHGNHRPMLLAALALHGEHDEATARLPALLREYRDGFFPTWRHFSKEGGSLKGWWYTTWTLNMELEVLAAVESAMGLGWFRTETWYAGLLDWYLVGLRGDAHFLKSGDTRMGDGFTPFDWIYCMSLVHYARDGRARWLANRIAANMDVWGVHRIWEVMWDEPEVVAQEPSGALVRSYRAAGHVILRDSWGDDAVIADFRSAASYTVGHSHLDDNSFTIFCRGGLAINSGLYDSFGSTHHMNYSRRTVAHNTILVHDPNERFVLQGTEAVNDGGQRWRSTAEGLPRSVPPHVESVLDPADGYRSGGVQLFEDAHEYAYALGDAAPSYSPRKLTVFDRHFLWLKAVAGSNRPVMVICDDVVSPSATFRKTYLLHSQTRPEVSGALATIANQGGVLYQQTLLPEGARLEVVGGAGREFWVAGNNYAPSREGAELDHAGRYRLEITSPSSQATERFLHVLLAGDAGATQAPRAARLDVTGGAGCAVGDWLAVFGLRKGGADSVAYTAPAGVTRHLVLRLVPNGVYSVRVDGADAQPVTASARGTVRLDIGVAARIELALTGS